MAIEDPNDSIKTESSVEEDQTLKRLTIKACPIMRDAQNEFKPLERHFGTLSTGMSFGESILMGASDRNRFFNAVALTDCVCLSLSKADFDYVVNSSERKLFNDKMQFLK